MKKPQWCAYSSIHIQLNWFSCVLSCVIWYPFLMTYIFCYSCLNRLKPATFWKKWYFMLPKGCSERVTAAVKLFSFSFVLKKCKYCLRSMKFSRTSLISNKFLRIFVLLLLLCKFTFKVCIWKPFWKSFKILQIFHYYLVKKKFITK